MQATQEKLPTLSDLYETLKRTYGEETLKQVVKENLLHSTAWVLASFNLIGSATYSSFAIADLVGIDRNVVHVGLALILGLGLAKDPKCRFIFQETKNQILDTFSFVGFFWSQSKQRPQANLPEEEAPQAEMKR